VEALYNLGEKILLLWKIHIVVKSTRMWLLWI
jgi:hypothetical protein